MGFFSQSQLSVQTLLRYPYTPVYSRLHLHLYARNAQSITVLSHWDFCHGKFGLLSHGESQLRKSRATQPAVHAGCFNVAIIHRTLTWTTGSLTCAQLLIRAIAHGGVQTLYQSLHWKLTLAEKSLAAPRTWAYVSGVPVRRSTNWGKTPPTWAKQKSNQVKVWFSVHDSRHLLVDKNWEKLSRRNREGII